MSNQTILTVPPSTLVSSQMTHNNPSKYNNLRFAVLIVLGIGGLAVAGIGVGGLLQAGSLSNLGQINSIVMVVIGGGGGIPPLIIGIIGFINTQTLKKNLQPPDNTRQADLEAKNAEEENKAAAALTIQKLWRGHLVRIQVQAEKRAQEDEIAAKARAELEAKNAEEENKAGAALTIQKLWRGHLAREKVEVIKSHYFLSDDLLAQAKPYIDTPSQLHNLPKVPEGKTTVYLPEGLPIVLKESGSPKNQKRLDQMKEARAICNGLGCHHLVIPKARVYANFIIEQRLPILHGTKTQMALYSEHRLKFTEAVKEFTAFLCQVSLDDITGYKDEYIVVSSRDVPLGRYDNIAFYLEEGQGKIGLIDLERFTPGCDRSNEDWGFFKCLTLVQLFPYHVGEIIETAKKYDPKIELRRQDVIAASKESLERFNIVCDLHRFFIKRKGVTPANPAPFKRVKQEEVADIEAELNYVLTEEQKNREGWLGCLGDEPELTLEKFLKDAFPKLLEATYVLIETLLNKNMEHHKKITSNAELLVARTLLFNRWAPAPEYKVFTDSTMHELTMFTVADHNKKEFLFFLLSTLLTSFCTYNVISYFNPRLGKAGDANCCIFC